MERSIKTINQKVSVWMSALLWAAVALSCLDERSAFHRQNGFEFVESSPTKAVTKTAFVNGDKIGIYVTKRSVAGTPAELSATPAQNYRNNVCYVYQNGAFVPNPGETEILSDGVNKLDFYVYYPYQATVANPLSLPFSVGTTMAGTNGTKDLMAARNRTGLVDGRVPLTFSHCLTYVKGSIALGAATATEVKLLGVKNGLTLNIGTATPSTTTATGDVVFELVKNGTSGTFEAVIPAQTFAAGTHLISLDNTEGDQLTYSVNSTVTTTPGKTAEIAFGDINKVTIKVDKTGKGTITGDRSGDYAAGVVYYPGQECSLTAAPATGYRFASWKEGATTLATTAALPPFVAAIDRTLLSVFAPITYFIKYDKNRAGGGGSMAPSTHTYDQPKKLTANAYTDGGTFPLKHLGWATTPTGDVEYPDQAEVLNLSSNDRDTLTLYARWGALQRLSAINYGSTGNACGAGLPAVFLPKTRIDIDAGTYPTKTFMYWKIRDGEGGFDDSTRVETTYTMGMRYTTIEAVWGNRITFHPNGGEGSMPPQVVLYDGNLNANRFTRPGYVFLKWKDEKGRSYEDKGYISIAENVELYAQWQNEITYTLSATNSGSTGDGCGNRLPRKFEAGAKVYLNAGDRPGFKFDRWEIRSTTGGAFDPPTDPVTTFTMPEGDATIYANWTQTTSGSTLSGSNSGSTGNACGAALPKPVAAGSVVAIDAGTRSGYTFSGWSSSNGGSFGSAGSASTTFTMPAGNTTITAGWTPVASDYTLSGSNSGSTGNACGAALPKPVAAGSVVAIDAGTRSGYTFSGWSTSNGGSFGSAGSASTTFTMPAGNTTITANWTTGNLTVTFDYNYEGKGTYTTKAVDKGGTVSAPTPPTRSEYTFQGWATTFNGTTFYNFSTPVTSNITLYAKWQLSITDN